MTVADGWRGGRFWFRSTQFSGWACH